MKILSSKKIYAFLFFFTIFYISSCIEKNQADNKKLYAHLQTATITMDLFTPNDNRNPLKNGSINPLKNGGINPLKNGSINPLKNSSINPLKNSSINPLKNSSINPLKNGSINPLKNSSINPLKNGSINPLKNGSINPLKNANFEGFYVFGLDSKAAKIAIKEENILVYFNPSFDFIEYAIHNEDEGYNVFDLEGKWIGYLQPDNNQGYLYFDTSNIWVGYLK